MKRPNVTVKLIMKYRNQILLLRDKKGIFTIPGGRMEWGESIFGALNRELKEELNFSLRQELIFFDLWNYVSKDKKRHSVFIYYIYVFKKKPRFFSPEGLQLLWLTKKELIGLNIIKDKSFINKIFR